MKYGIGFALEKTCFLEACNITGSARRKTAGLSGPDNEYME
jgi:hypothetical protein